MGLWQSPGAGCRKPSVTLTFFLHLTIQVDRGPSTPSPPKISKPKNKTKFSQKSPRKDYPSRDQIPHSQRMIHHGASGTVEHIGQNRVN